MSNTLIDRFEHQVDALLHHFDRLKHENRSLREKQASILAERNKLADNQQAVTATIERLIERLKLMVSE
jgi:cell division protein ZapB